MKRHRLYLVLLFIPLISTGQIQAGFKGGYDYFWFNDGNSDPRGTLEYSIPENSYMFALSARQRSPHVFNLGMELQYVHRSFAVKADWGSFSGGSTVDLNYTLGNICLQIQPQFVIGSKFKFFVYPGIYFGTLLHSSAYGTSHSWSMVPYTVKNDTINGSAKNYYPGLEFGISPGLGVEFPVYGDLNFVFEYNFTMSITSVGRSWETDNVRIFSMNFEIGLAYTFKTTASDQ